MNTVKRVKPYPISCGISKAEGQPLVGCEIIKLTEVGFLIRIGSHLLLRVGDNLKCHFELVNEDLVFDLPVKVIKTYQGLDASGSHVPVAVPGEKISTVELHFRELPVSHKDAIFRFVKKIGQK